MRTARTFIAGASLFALLVGCSSGNEDTASADSEASASVSTTEAPVTTTIAATPTTPGDPMAAAQAVYYALTAGTNAASEAAYNSVVEGDAIPWANYPVYCRKIAELDEQFARDLEAYAWPSEVQDDVDAAIPTIAAEAAQLYKCADAPGTYEGQAHLGAAAQASADANTAALSALRLALGLSTDR